MPLHVAEINSVKIVFDKEKTKKHRTEYNEPCRCLDCRNFRKNIQQNRELLEFLAYFGVDYRYAEEVFSWELNEKENSFIHSQGYYGVFGEFEGEEFSFERYGVKIAFSKEGGIPYDREGEFFWIIVEGDFPYILDEERKN